MIEFVVAFLAGVGVMAIAAVVADRWLAGGTFPLPEEWLRPPVPEEAEVPGRNMTERWMESRAEREARLAGLLGKPDPNTRPTGEALTEEAMGEVLEAEGWGLEEGPSWKEWPWEEEAGHGALGGDLAMGERPVADRPVAISLEGEALEGEALEALEAVGYMEASYRSHLKALVEALPPEAQEAYRSARLEALRAKLEDRLMVDPEGFPGDDFA